jgi:cell division protein FtsX
MQKIKKLKSIMKKTTFSLVAIIAVVFFGVNILVWLNVNRLMSETQNSSMCEIAASVRCSDYVDRTDVQTERVFSTSKNDFSTIAAIKIYQKRNNKTLEELKIKQNLTSEEEKILEDKLKIESYHQKILKVVNNNIDVNQMDFLEKKIYKSLMRR